MNKQEGENEVARLTKELKNMQEMFRQLTEEGKSESYSARRTYMLKAQIVQLERQCMLLSDALSSRSSIMMETENALIALTQEFQELLAKDVRGPTVEMSRKKLISHIHALQQLKGSMHKQSVLSSAENLRIPQLCGTKFCKSENLSCLDTCSGNIDHLNLQYVALLESKLANLLERLTSLQTLLRSHTQEVPPEDADDSTMPEKYLYSPMFERVNNCTKVCVEQLEDCCQDLISLSLLHPSAPWRVIQNSAKYGLFNPSEILGNLSPAIRQKKEVKLVIATMCKAHNYLMNIHRMRLKATEKELKFCNQACLTYSHYVNSFVQGIMQAYNDCEVSLTDMINEPIDAILKSWLALKETQSEDAMRNFMSAFKTNEQPLNKLLRKVQVKTESREVSDKRGPDETNSGLQAFQDFRTLLKERILVLQQQCAKESAKLLSEINDYTEAHEYDIVDKLRKAIANDKSDVK